MKFSPQQFIGALGGLTVGLAQGKDLKRQRAQQQDDDLLSAIPHLMALSQAQNDQALEPYKLAASAPGQTPESQQAAYQALIGAQQGQPQVDYAGMARPVLQRRFPHAQLPTPAAPGGRPPVPTPVFEAPGQAQATSEVVSQLHQISQNALSNGDEAGAGQVRDLLVKLARKQITPEQALQSVGGIETQGKVTAAQDRTLEEPFSRLRKQYDELRVKEPLRGQVGDILNRYGQLPAAGPERRAGLRQLSQALGGVGDYADLSPDDRRQEQTARSIGEGRIYEMDRKFTADLARVKGSPKDVLAVADAYHRWAQTPDAQKYGARVPAELDPTPQPIVETGPDREPVSRLETAEEVDARRMGGAAKYLEDPKDKAALQKTRIALLGRLLTSGRIQGSLEPVLGQLEDALNGGAEPVKLSGLKFDQMTAQQREQIRQFNERTAQGDRNFGLREGQLKLDMNRQELENSKFAWKKEHPTGNRRGPAADDISKRDAKLLQEAQKARTIAQKIINGVDGKLIKEPEDEQRKADALKQMRAAQGTITRIVGPLGEGGEKEPMGPPVTPPQPKPAAAKTSQQKRSVFIAALMRGAPGKPGLNRQTAEKYANRQKW